MRFEACDVDMSHKTSGSVPGSGCKQNSNEIPTDIPMFPGSSYPIRIVLMLYDQMGSNRK